MVTVNRESNRTFDVRQLFGVVFLATIIRVSVQPSQSAGQDSVRNRPNVLLIITDQQHANMLSCAGNQNLKTPALDSLAANGIRFENAYVTNPVCVPSRISMATGIMAGRLGVLNNGVKADVPLEVSENSLGELFKKAGYATFYGGKTHMCPELNPPGAGYDEYFRDQRDALPGACINFIRQHQDQPFLAVASFINPHDICFAYSAFKGQSPATKASVEHLYQQALALPLDQLPALPDNYRIPDLEPAAIEIYSNPKAVTPSFTMRRVYDERQWRIYRWIYCRLTEQVDAHIGRILNSIVRFGMDERTLVVFTSDHGDMDACHRLASKGRFYDQSVCVPLLMQWKGVVPAGQVDSHLVSSGLDILPTVCDFAGIEVPPTLLGRSLRPIACGETNVEWRDYVVTENHTGRMLRSPEYKYCVYDDGEPRESLVHMRDDPGEMHNLVENAEYQEVLNENRRLLQQWVESSDDRQAQEWLIATNPAPGN